MYAAFRSRSAPQDVAASTRTERRVRERQDRSRNARDAAGRQLPQATLSVCLTKHPWNSSCRGRPVQVTSPTRSDLGRNRMRMLSASAERWSACHRFAVRDPRLVLGFTSAESPFALVVYRARAEQPGLRRAGDRLLLRRRAVRLVTALPRSRRLSAPRFRVLCGTWASLFCSSVRRATSIRGIGRWGANLVLDVIGTLSNPCRAVEGVATLYTCKGYSS